MNRFQCFLGALVLLTAVPIAGRTDAIGDSRTVATEAAARLERGYVYPSIGTRAADALRRAAAAGTYDGLRDQQLALKLTADLQSVVNDKHVRVRYSPEVNPPAGPTDTKPSKEEQARDSRRDREMGYGLRTVRHLPGNVGYLDIRGFAGSATQTNVVLDAAVNAVAFSDAIVIDVRRNGGGSSEAVARLVSHFVQPKTHINDFVERGDGIAKVAESSYTTRVSGPVLAAPVFILTSGRTFSAAEEFAYDLQTLKRATIVGEVTGGGANPGDEQRIDDHFAIFVPTMRARNPITQTNWEHVGVRPDRVTPADRALAAAYAAALDAKVADTTLPDALRDGFKALRARLDALNDAEILAL